MNDEVREAIERVKKSLDGETFVSEEQIAMMTILDWIEDEAAYEYAIQGTELASGKVWVPQSAREFGTLEETLEALDLETSGEDGAYYKDDWKFDIVRRRKAGPLEIYKDEEGN